MLTEIKCPNCGTLFEPNESLRKELRDEISKEANAKAEEWRRKKEKEFADEKNKLQQSLEESIRKSMSADYEYKLKLAEQHNKENEEKLKSAREQQVEYLKKEKALKTKEEELEIQIHKTLQAEREKLSLEIRQFEEQRNAAKETEHQLKVKELEERLASQKKLTDEMQRKMEQGSMQAQGESQELLLEELLRNSFPFDVVSEVGKGVRGADCIQTVRNNLGQECGAIIFESKRTKDFSAEWIEKIKKDMRSQGATAAVIVTQALPKDLERFGEKEGVWICSFAEVKAVVHMLRDGIIKISAAIKSQENKGDKMTLLYSYLTSHEFAEQWQAIREGFMSMKMSIQKERDAMEKLWKAREKQLEKVMLNAAHVRGSIEGISGSEVDLNLLDDGNDDLQLD